MQGKGMPLLTAEKYVEAHNKRLSLVHPIETTIDSRLPHSYSDYRARRHADEYQAALSLYCHIDNIEGTTRAEHFLQCRRWAYFARHRETGKVKVISNACRLRWCPLCAEAKANLIRSNVSEWMKTVKRPKLLTLTVQHTNEPLGVQIERLYKQFRLFRQHKTLKKAIRGGVWFFQLTYRPKSCQWHPHLHCVLDANYISKRLLSLEWLATTGNSFVIDIRAIKHPEKVAFDVARYTSRPCRLADFDKKDQTEIFTVFHRKRFCGGFGTGRQSLLLTKSFEGRANWQRLPAWEIVIANQRDNGAFQAILSAWLSNTSVSYDAVASVIQPDPDKDASEYLHLTIIEEKQAVFKEFR